MSVWLVISSHRNDDEVVRMLSRVHERVGETFDRILVVDSEGTGKLPELILERGWQDVDYRCYAQNLGSGGNLCERLRLAAEGGAKYAYALNHDGNFDGQAFAKLLEVAASLKDLGAAYPLSFFTSVGHFNLTGTRELPLPAKLVKDRPGASLIDVYWSSSNGALYSLDPVRRGVLPWPVMWMAWEDMEYGWRLASSGYRQVIVRDAIYRDNYEYAQSWLGNTVDKPAWRTYYNARNLILAVRRSRNTQLFHAAVCYRLLRELALIILAKDSKKQRLGGLLKGTLDGWRTKIDRSDDYPRKAEEFQQATPISR
jgi:GT2 family glycosyltransferase